MRLRHVKYETIMLNAISRLRIWDRLPHLFAAAVVGLSLLASVHAEEVDPKAATFFESKIRPLLVEQCHECHGEKKQKGGLRLDSLAGVLRGGESGPAVVPAAPQKSLLIKAVSYKDNDLQMPPKKKLGDRQMAELAQWVLMGAPWPGAEKVAGAARPVEGGMRITDADRKWWAFRPVARPTDPDKGIDHFISAGLKEKGLEPNAPAGRRELIRRAYVDLIGLPPTPEDIRAFEANVSPDAFEKVIDGLLARPQYGERWARMWLDVVRYAQTNGYERDGEKPLAWRYRDYVIKAFNEDRPYDRFVREQLAGDELDDVTNDSITATGLYRLGVWDDEPDDKRASEYDYLDDNVVTISAVFMGLTVGCARCHDHKFDPIPQADYYRLLAFIHNMKPHDAGGFDRDSATYTPLAPPADAKKWFDERDAQIAQLKSQIDTVRQGVWKRLYDTRMAVTPTDEDVTKALDEKDREAIGRLEREIEKIHQRKPPFEWALSVREQGISARPTYVMVRGNPASRGMEVQPAFLTVLGGKTPTARPTGQSPGLRRTLAEWITGNDHPLTARVMVNRIWQGHFGQGIVRTPNDFGKTGIAPTHAELLDWLAWRFVQDGWSIKKMHKRIMLTQAYQRSSTAGNEKAELIDPDNKLLWRQYMRRMSAEAIRDSILAVSGSLNRESGGRGFFPRLSREVIASGSRPGLGWEVSDPAQRYRRSVYVFTKRTMLPPILESFDFNNTAFPVATRTDTTVAPQALMLLNDDFMHEQAAALSRRLISKAGIGEDARIVRLFELALGRRPGDREKARAMEYFQSQKVEFERLRGQVDFRPDVPAALSDQYLKQLKPEDFVNGPRENWTYRRGAWGGNYEGIVNVDLQRGPFALFEGTKFVDGVIEGKLKLHHASELASVLVRGSAAGHLLVGYEVALDPKHQTATLLRHEKESAKVIGTASATVIPGDWHAVKVQAAGGRIRFRLDGTDVLDLTDPNPILNEGYPGLKTWGAALTVEDMSAGVAGEGGARVNLTPPRDAQWSDQQAWRSLCLVVLNLNEFVYID
jgi:mono/diheme cytochrome c family protein